MAATISKNASRVINFLGFEHTGSKVIAQTKDGDQFKVRCACSVEFVAKRSRIITSRRKGRRLQCYDCWCKCVQEGARQAAATRNRTSGRFAPGFEEVDL